MDFITENWVLIIIVTILLAGAITAAVRFFKKPTEQQVKDVKEWLVWATTLAEKELGSGTGKLKLRMVYDMFVAKFGWLAKLVSFDFFSDLVDEALDETNKLLASNSAVQLFVNGPAEEDTEADG